MSAHWAKPGAKCVCIDADWSKTPPKKLAMAKHLPVQGEIYTVRRVRSYAGHGTFILLEELRNPQAKYGRWNGEPQFDVLRFKPLVEPPRTQSQDIAEHFKKLLDTKAQIERAPLDIPMLDEVGQ